MDPVSFLATLTGIIGFGATLATQVQALSGAFKSAPDAIKELSTDLDDIDALCVNLRDIIESYKEKKVVLATGTGVNLKRVLQNCRNTLERLQKAMKPFQSEEEMKRWSFKHIKVRINWIIDEGDVLKIRDSLESRKNSLQISIQLLR
jgi:hypothetical protein